MDKNNNLSDSFKKISVSSMLTYLRGLSTDNLESVIRWAKASKNPDTKINTANPSEWEKNMKLIFSQLNNHEQAEVVSQASKILDEKKSLEAKSHAKK